MIYLVLGNAAHVKNLPGRNTNVKDAEWLAELMAHGLVKVNFMPDEPTQQMRESVAHAQAVGARALEPHPAHPEGTGRRQHQAGHGGPIFWA